MMVASVAASGAPEHRRLASPAVFGEESVCNRVPRVIIASSLEGSVSKLSFSKKIRGQSIMAKSNTQTNGDFYNSCSEHSSRLCVLEAALPPVKAFSLSL